VLLAIASKNQSETVQKAFRNPQMVLTLDNFITTRINFDAKSVNIKSILSELNLTEQGVIFIDDSIVERDEIESFLPDITVLTEEDTQKLQQYKTEKIRQQSKIKFNSVTEWINSLNIQINVIPVTLDNYQQYQDRIYQMINKINQMKLNTNKTDNLLHLLLNNNLVYVLEVTDKFGNYGIVGCSWIHQNEIKGLWFSCRIMGKGIETGFINQLVKLTGIQNLIAVYEPTKYNTPMKDWVSKYQLKTPPYTYQLTNVPN